MLTDALRLLLFPAMMAFAASSDLLTMTISNRVSLILAGGYFALALATGASMGEVLTHCGAGLLVLAVTFIFFAAGWIGGGDAKLAAATALWLGFDHLLSYFVVRFAAGRSIDGPAHSSSAAWPMPSFLVGREWAERLHRQDAGIPYGIALAVAALLIYPETAWMKAIG